MSPTRREAIARLAALAATAALPRSSWAAGGASRTNPDPLDGTIADYLAASFSTIGCPRRRRMPIFPV